MLILALISLLFIISLLEILFFITYHKENTPAQNKSFAALYLIFTFILVIDLLLCFQNLDNFFIRDGLYGLTVYALGLSFAIIWTEAIFIRDRSVFEMSLFFSLLWLLWRLLVLAELAPTSFIIYPLLLLLSAYLSMQYPKTQKYLTRSICTWDILRFTFFHAMLLEGRILRFYEDMVEKYGLRKGTFYFYRREVFWGYGIGGYLFMIYNNFWVHFLIFLLLQAIYTKLKVYFFLESLEPAIFGSIELLDNSRSPKVVGFYTTSAVLRSSVLFGRSENLSLIYSSKKDRIPFRVPARHMHGFGQHAFKRVTEMFKTAYPHFGPVATITAGTTWTAIEVTKMRLESQDRKLMADMEVAKRELETKKYVFEVKKSNITDEFARIKYYDKENIPHLHGNPLHLATPINIASPLEFTAVDRDYIGFYYKNDDKYLEVEKPDGSRLLYSVNKEEKPKGLDELTKKSNQGFKSALDQEDEDLSERLIFVRRGSNIDRDKILEESLGLRDPDWSQFSSEKDNNLRTLEDYGESLADLFREAGE